MKNVLCPVCKQHYFEENEDYDFCPICYWQDDRVQLNDHDYKGGANKLSVNIYRNEWKTKRLYFQTLGYKTAQEFWDTWEDKSITEM